MDVFRSVFIEQNRGTRTSAPGVRNQSRFEPPAAPGKPRHCIARRVTGSKHFDGNRLSLPASSSSQSGIPGDDHHLARNTGGNRVPPQPAFAPAWGVERAALEVLASRRPARRVGGSSRRQISLDPHPGGSLHPNGRRLK